MQMLYNSDSFAVVRFVLDAEPAAGDMPGPVRGGYEIIDKLARKEIYLDGALAERFKLGVEALIDTDPRPDSDAVDDFLAGYTLLAQQPLTLH